MKNRHDARLSMILAVAALAVAAVSCQSPPENNEADIAALKALDQAYAREWLEGNADGVMALFTEDATLVPHHGDTPVVGSAAIRDFWFHPDYPPTVVPAWTRDAKEVVVYGELDEGMRVRVNPEE